MPQYDKFMLIVSDTAMMTGGAEYGRATGNVINSGVTQPDLGKTQMFGAHIIITTTFATTMTSCIISIVHGSSATPTTILSSRYFAIADMTAGKHFFIPCAPGLLQYFDIYCAPAGGNPGTGKMTVYFGPDEDGTE